MFPSKVNCLRALKVTKLVLLITHQVECSWSALQNWLALVAVSLHYAFETFQKVVSQTNGRRPVSCQYIKRDCRSNSTNNNPMEAIVNKQVRNNMLIDKVISDKQFDFRPHRSTTDLRIILTQTWNASLDRNEEVCIIACDIKVALTKCGTMSHVPK